MGTGVKSSSDFNICLVQPVSCRTILPGGATRDPAEQLLRTKGYLHKPPDGDTGPQWWLHGRIADDVFTVEFIVTEILKRRTGIRC